MSDDNNTKLVVREEYATQLKTFEAGFLSVVNSYGLPSQNIFVDVTERAMVFRNVDAVLYQMREDQRSNSIYSAPIQVVELLNISSEITKIEFSNC